MIAKLQAAGLDVKAAASSVDEDDIAMAFDGGPGRNGGATAPATEEPAPAPPAGEAAPGRTGRGATHPQRPRGAAAGGGAEQDAAAAW